MASAYLPGAGNGNVFHSLDGGATWAEGTETVNFYDCVFAPAAAAPSRQFLFPGDTVASPRDIVKAYAADGVSVATYYQVPSALPARSLAWSPTLGRWVVLFNFGATFISTLEYTSTLATWPWTAASVTPYVMRVRCSGSRFVAVGADAAYSDDGITWTVAAGAFESGGSGYGMVDLATDGAGNWIAVGYAGAGPLVSKSSDNGTTWSDATTLIAGGMSAVYGVATDGAGRWVVAGQQAGVPWFRASTDDGATWNDSLAQSTYGAGYASKVAFSQGSWLAASTDGTDCTFYQCVQVTALPPNVPWVAIAGGTGIISGLAQAVPLPPPPSVLPLRQLQRNDGLTTGPSRVRAGLNRPTSAQKSLRQRGYR